MDFLKSVSPRIHHAVNFVSAVITCVKNWIKTDINIVEYLKMSVISYSKLSFCKFTNTFSGREIIELDDKFLLRGNFFQEKIICTWNVRIWLRWASKISHNPLSSRWIKKPLLDTKEMALKDKYLVWKKYPAENILQTNWIY